MFRLPFPRRAEGFGERRRFGVVAGRLTAMRFGVFGVLHEQDEPVVCQHPETAIGAAEIRQGRCDGEIAAACFARRFGGNAIGKLNYLLIA